MNKRHTAAYQKEKNLKFSKSDIYDVLLKALNERNIHAYDVNAGIVYKENGADIILHFGEEYQISTSCYFPYDTLEQHHDELITFFNIRLNLAKTH